MAIYTNLPVFKASYDLMIEVFNLCGSLPKDYKYTVGERLKNALMDLMLGIYEANISDDKSELLAECRRYMVGIKLYLRMLRDMKLVSVNRFAVIAEHTENISKQLAAWQKAQKKVTSGVPREVTTFAGE
jgi:hypothetical protein